MTLFPRTLLWRSVLHIALLLGIAHFAWLEILRESERAPRARQVAQQIASVVNLTRAALINSQPSKRLGLLQELSQREGIQVYLGNPGERIAPLPDRPFLRIAAAELRRHLGPDTRIATSRGGVRGAWVSFRIDQDEYWVFMPRSRLDRPDPLRWLGWALLVLALAMLGAYLIVSRINRPLRELTRAAAETGRGKMPPPVEESGPAEIRTLSRAFNQMTSDLKRLDDERALLLAGVSHDLRTPLSRIRLGLEMMGGEGDATLKSGLIQDIEDIDAAINQFLDFARVGNGETPAPGEDLNALVRSACDRYQRAGDAVAFRHDAVPPLALRPLAIQRLVRNLVDNALRHGGPPVEVTTGAADGNAVIEVLDRGPGIPPGEARRMLQPFTRLDSARSGAGTGLGLAIVERIARLHGGSVRLLPRDGRGLRVRVELPVEPAGEPKAAPAGDAGRQPPSESALPERLLESSFIAVRRAKRGVFIYNRNDLFVGRSIDLYGEWCDAELDLLLGYLKPGDTVLDVGANIGTHAVPFAAAVGGAGTVFAFEPQRLFFQILCGNVALNGLTNVRCLPQAVGAARGSVRIPQLAPMVPNNFAALPASGHASGENIDVVTVDSLGLTDCRLIKIDAEGMEPDVLRGARDTISACRPVLFVENNTVEKSASTLAAIRETGYRMWWHIAPYYNERNYLGNRENVFTKYFPEANLLCLPPDAEPRVPGLVECTVADDNWQAACRRMRDAGTLPRELSFVFTDTSPSPPGPSRP